MADEKIRELITVLDGQKDEAIERTFKQVAKNFAEVFKELVPEGTRLTRGVLCCVYGTPCSLALY